MKIKTSDKYTVKQILRWLWQAWRGNRLQATLNALLGVADVVLSLAQVWAIKYAIDVASGSDRGSIYWAVGLMGALILLNFAVNIAGVWVRNILGVRAQNRMQQQRCNAYCSRSGTAASISTRATCSTAWSLTWLTSRRSSPRRCRARSPPY